MPDRLTDERLHQLVHDEYVCNTPETRSMAAELIDARAELDRLRASDAFGDRHAEALVELNDELRARVAELARDLHDAGNSAGRLEDQLRVSCTQGADAAARVAELEAEMPDRIELRDSVRGLELTCQRLREAAHRPPLGYVVIAKAPSRFRPGCMDYANPSIEVYATKDAARDAQQQADATIADQPTALYRAGLEHFVAELREVQP